MARARFPPPEPSVLRALAPFINLSALAAALFITAFGMLFLLPLWLAERSAWTGGGVGLAILALALPMLLVVYAASRTGVLMHVRPLMAVASEVQRALGQPAPSRARGRLRRGWGAEVAWALEGEEVRAVAARGQLSRPDLYLVRGEREYRFRDVRRPLGEVDEALRAVGLR